jgi:hypothetical protein
VEESSDASHIVARMIGGYVSGAVLAVSGIAGVLIPRQVAAPLDIGLPTGRARAELRIAYAAFGALGVWALIAGESALFTGIGVLWLGAAGVRLITLAVDRPKADALYWAILAMEVGFGILGVLGSG